MIEWWQVVIVDLVVVAGIVLAVLWSDIEQKWRNK